MSRPTFEFEYVLGFAFNRAARIVWLSRKLRPEWQCGRVNGIGGKIVDEEDGTQAMRREFQEATGLDVEEDHWRLFGRLDTLTPGTARVWLFAHERPPGPGFVPVDCSEEIVFPVKFEDVRDLPDILPDLRWMLPLALAEPNVRADVRQIV